jgi:hypothetical protein
MLSLLGLQQSCLGPVDRVLPLLSPEVVFVQAFFIVFWMLDRRPGSVMSSQVVIGCGKTNAPAHVSSLLGFFPTP